MDEGKKGRFKRIALLAAGVGIGALNGLLGGGGGMIAVPTLRYLGGLPTKKAHATAIAVMLPLSLSSAVLYALGGVWDVGLGGLSAVSVSVGGLIGAGLLSALRSSVIALLFYLLMTAAGVLGVLKWFG